MNFVHKLIFVRHKFAYEQAPAEDGKKTEIGEHETEEFATKREAIRAGQG